MEDKTLPKDDSDFSLPGRMEESNSAYFDEPIEPEIEIEAKPKNRTLVIAAVIFVVVSVGFFSYYFMNQSDIDSQILDNTLPMSQEQKMVSQYGVGEFGSDHDHAALAMFVEGSQINFGMPQFQLQSKYIHFENHNPYLIHKHATNVPLKMLFASFGLEITSQCLVFSYKTGEEFCVDSENTLTFVINGKYYSDISEYEIKHNDRILISFGDSELVSEQLEYLKSLKIQDIPKQDKLVPGRDILI